MKEQEKERFKRYKKTLLKIIHDELPGCKVFLFGSRARGDYDMGADIDLALDWGKKIDQCHISNIVAKIEETTIPLSIDLVDLFDADETLKKEVVEEGILWEN